LDNMTTKKTAPFQRCMADFFPGNHLKCEIIGAPGGLERRN
jgi:hypothetical protein